MRSYRSSSCTPWHAPLRIVAQRASFRALISHWSILIVISFAPFQTNAQASDTADKATTTSATSTQAQPTPTDNCPDHIPPPTADASSDPQQGSLTVADDTRWQPSGGDIHFKLGSLASDPQNITVYFRWQEGKSRECVQSTRVQFISREPSDGDNKTVEYSYSARLPDLDKPKPPLGVAGWGHRTWTSAAPLADMYVHVVLKGSEAGATPILTVGRVGVSTPWVAVVIAFLMVAFAWLVLLHWASQLNIPGRGPIRIISTPYGVTSLSQFQIAIWTTVIGAGVTYVMLVSGNLINIPPTTLALLGITGLALIGSKVQANADGTPARVSVPGAVSSLSVLGQPTSTTVVLSWTPPTDTLQPFTYTVQMRLSGAGSWSTIAIGIGTPPYAVTGLQPSTSYDFQVFASNSGGAGPASVAVSQWTTGVPTPAAAAPVQVTGLTAAAGTDGTITLHWSGLAPAPDAYVVQYRASGALPWATYSNTGTTSAVVSGLDAATKYEFLVFAITGGVAGSPSLVAVASTASRTPKWSDLVVSSGGAVEIDLTRVQMLLFTSIAAGFTALTLLDTGKIPDIPVGILALVGISNGVYFTAKTVAPSR